MDIKKFENIINQSPKIIEEYLTADNVREDRPTNDQLLELIKETGNIEKYLTPEIMANFNFFSNDIVKLIKETGNIEKYFTPEMITNFKLNSFDITELIKETGNIEKYLTPETITKFKLDSLDTTELIRETGDIEKYLTSENITNFKLNSFDVTELIRETGDIEKYLTPEMTANFKLNDLNITKLIKETGNIEKYSMDSFQDYELDRMLFGPSYEKNRSNNFSIANVIKATGNIEKYLMPEMIANLELNSPNIAKLIEETGNIEGHLTPEIIVSLNRYDITKLIKATGNIEKYLFDGEDEYSLLSIANVIKGLNFCPNLNDSEIKLFNNFDDEITKTILNIDVEKQKNAIILLQRLDKNNSAELRRIKIPMALQILEKNPKSYEETLSRIEEIYLTNDIPTVGKSYLVFQELHPNFLGIDNNKKDESSAKIPSLQNSSGSEKKHLIFTNLLMCALESNDRNIRDYIKVIDNGDKLYRDYLEGRLELENLDEDNEKIKILSRYSSILNTLYNVTSNGRREKTRENSGNLGNDLKELDKLFESDRIKLNLPDRLVRTFAFGSNIRTFEQAKSIFKNSRENAHEKNIAISKQGTIILEEGDFIKGIANSEYFPSMLQKGILAKDFLGRNANSDCTPLDTDVEKITSIKKSFSETLNSLSIANVFTNGDVSGKALGSIMLVFSKDDFIETRDSSGNVNQKNVELVKNGNNKKEVFHNFDSAYGISTGIGSTHIKCIVADRYVDKLGLEIAKNGFYIPIVDKSGKVIYTEKMYEDFREKMRGLSYYDGDEFVLDETAINEDIKQITKDIDLNLKNANEKKEKIVKVLKCATEKMGYSLSEKRRTDLMPGIVELIDTGSTGRGTNEPGTGDFDFMVRMDKQLSDSPTELKNEYRKHLGNVDEPSETGKGDFRYKGVKVEGLNNPVDLDLTFTERTDEIEYTTDECIKERLKNIKNQNPEEHKYVLANILLAKKFLKLSGVYKKSNAAPPENGQADTRGGLGAVGIENWILQNGGSFEAASKSFISVANECKNLEEFKKKYAIWDFGENYISANSNIYPHDNFIYNMNETGFERMKIALTKYLEITQTRKSNKIGFEDLAGQVVEEIKDSEYMYAIRNLTEKMKNLQEAKIK